MANSDPIKIALSNGGHTIIDPEDFALVSQYTWRAQRNADGVTGVATGQKRGFKLLHRLVCKPERDQVVDHVNGDPLDNRRANLRACSQVQNLQNRKMHKNNTSGYKGVYFHRQSRKYRAEIAANRRRVCLGAYDTAEDAHKAYALMAQELHGEFARGD